MKRHSKLANYALASVALEYFFVAMLAAGPNFEIDLLSAVFFYTILTLIIALPPLLSIATCVVKRSVSGRALLTLILWLPITLAIISPALNR
jgi:hypothetical protein